MFGRNQSKYRNGKNFFDNFWNTITSPEYQRFGGNLQAGMPVGLAGTDASDWAYNRDLQDRMMGMRELGFNRDIYSQSIGDELNLARLGQMTAPPPPPERYSDVYNEQGDFIGQRDDNTNKMHNFNLPQQPKRERAQGADGRLRYVDDGSLVFPNVEVPMTNSTPKIITKNMPNGAEQDYIVQNGELVPFGEVKENATVATERRGKADIIGRTISSIENYKKLLKQHGTEQMPGQAKLNLQSSYYDLLMEMKELYDLGVLNGPDLDLMQDILKDPTAITSTFYDGDALIEQINAAVIPRLQSARTRFKETYGVDAPNFPEQNTTSLPQVGQAIDGYIFQGGDPGNPNSWRKQ